MNAEIEKQSPCHFKATLESMALGTFRTEQDARDAIHAAMLKFFNYVPTNAEDLT